MAYCQYECFCHLTYDSELTYEALLECETMLTETMQNLLTILGAVHVDFVPAGDSLYVQWALAQRDDEAFGELCASLATLAGNSVQGRLLIVDRDLDRLQCYSVDKGAWQTWTTGWTALNNAPHMSNTSLAD